MPFVLDTTAMTALMRGELAVVQRLFRVEPTEIWVPQPVVAELRYGLARLPRSRRKAALELRANELLSALPRAPWTDDVSARFGAIKEDLQRRGVRIEDFNVAIAAHALSLYERSDVSAFFPVGAAAVATRGPSKAADAGWRAEARSHAKWVIASKPTMCRPFRLTRIASRSRR